MQAANREQNKNVKKLVHLLTEKDVWIKQEMANERKRNAIRLFSSFYRDHGIQLKALRAFNQWKTKIGDELIINHLRMDINTRIGAEKQKQRELLGEVGAGVLSRVVKKLQGRIFKAAIASLHSNLLNEKQKVKAIKKVMNFVKKNEKKSMARAFMKLLATRSEAGKKHLSTMKLFTVACQVESN